MIKLKVPDMSCDHCVRTIEKSIKSVDPTAAIEIDLNARLVSVDTKTNVETIAEAIRGAGYGSEAMAG